VPEILKNGLTGFIVETVDEAAAAVSQLGSIDRTKVRDTFERRFSVEVMAKNYEDTYADICTTRERVDTLQRRGNGSATIALRLTS